MTQLSVMDLAKQGDPHAIAALINRSLASKGLHAEAELEFDCLKISLQAAQIPNQKAVVTIIHRGMIVLQVEKIKRVKISTYRSDNHYLAWQHEIDLGLDLGLDPSINLGTTLSGELPESNESKQSLPSSQNPKDSDRNNEDHQIMQGQNMNLVNNPKGVILVQKLSQIQQNLQEYQDIIVRFTDEQVGTVRCLTTLTELIQVISRPSFLFAAVASNPNLRSLLDTIAESSQTDEHGDQVITNLSILQPGQQWQKAKIRLVSKIFLEPAETTQDEDLSPVRHQGITLDLAETNSESEIAPTAVPSLENITVGALFEDFPDSSPPPSQDIFDKVSGDDLPSNSVTTEPDLPAKSESITVVSLFDDFPEPMSSNSQSFQSIQVVNDITEISGSSDSLFDDFVNGDSSNSSLNTIDTIDTIDVNSYDNLTVSISSTVELPEPPSDGEDDLFGSFSSQVSPVDIASEFDRPEPTPNIDEIKSRIPKQNLDQLLQLLDEEDQTKAEMLTVNNSSVQDSKPNNSDIGAITLESILSNMETITLSGLGSKSSSDFVTLDDFSQELDSVGF